MFAGVEQPHSMLQLLFLKFPGCAPNGYKDVLTSKVGLTGPQLTVISITDLIALPGILPAEEEKKGLAI